MPFRRWALIASAEWMHAPFVLLRGAYESAALAVWLLDTEFADLRLARLLAQHSDSWNYSAKAYRGTSLDDDGEHDERLHDTARMIADAGLEPSQCRFPGFEKLVESVDDFPGERASLLTAWRLCSGVSHAKTWAMKTVTVEVERVDQSEHLHFSARVPDSDLAVALLGAGRRTVERACVLCSIRTTSRPHSIRLGMSVSSD